MPNHLTGSQRRAAKFLMFASAFGGRFSMLVFVVFLYAGPFEYLQVQLPRLGWPVWDILLSFLFFLQHSTMIRRGVRAGLSRWIPTYYHGAIFSLASAFALIILVLFWQPSGIKLMELHGPVQWLTRVVFFASAAGAGWGVWSLGRFDPFGTSPIRTQLYGRPEPRSMPFSVRGPYRWVRHPLYFFVLLMMWVHPDLTADRLLFNLLWSGWIYIGTILEEKDLVSDFGDHYRDYQKKVPMLIPLKRFL